MAPSRVFGAYAGRALMAAAAKSAAKKAAASSGAASTTTVKKAASSRANVGIQKVVPVSSELGKFLGSPEVSRTDAVKRVWEYIKLQNLQVFFSYISVQCRYFSLRSSFIIFISLCKLVFELQAQNRVWNVRIDYALVT